MVYLWRRGLPLNPLDEGDFCILQICCLHGVISRVYPMAWYLVMQASYGVEEESCKSSQLMPFWIVSKETSQYIWGLHLHSCGDYPDLLHLGIILFKCLFMWPLRLLTLRPSCHLRFFRNWSIFWPREASSAGFISVGTYPRLRFTVLPDLRHTIRHECVESCCVVWNVS